MTGTLPTCSGPSGRRTMWPPQPDRLLGAGQPEERGSAGGPKWMIGCRSPRKGPDRLAAVLGTGAVDRSRPPRESACRTPDPCQSPSARTTRNMLPARYRRLQMAPDGLGEGRLGTV